MRIQNPSRSGECDVMNWFRKLNRAASDAVRCECAVSASRRSVILKCSTSPPPKNATLSAWDEEDTRRDIVATLLRQSVGGGGGGGAVSRETRCEMRRRRSRRHRIRARAHAPVFSISVLCAFRSFPSKANSSRLDFRKFGTNHGAFITAVHATMYAPTCAVRRGPVIALSTARFTVIANAGRSSWVQRSVS
jgi:hypothetical protein